MKQFILGLVVAFSLFSSAVAQPPPETIDLWTSEYGAEWDAINEELDSCENEGITPEDATPNYDWDYSMFLLNAQKTQTDLKVSSLNANTSLLEWRYLVIGEMLQGWPIPLARYKTSWPLPYADLDDDWAGLRADVNPIVAAVQPTSSYGTAFSDAETSLEIAKLIRDDIGEMRTALMNADPLHDPTDDYAIVDGLISDFTDALNDFKTDSTTAYLHQVHADVQAVKDEWDGSLSIIDQELRDITAEHNYLDNQGWYDDTANGWTWH